MKLPRPWFAAILLTLGFVSACSQAASAPPTKSPGELTICSYAHFTPVAYGNGEGYEPDLLKAVAQRWGLTPVFTPIEAFDGIWLTPSDAGLGCDVAVGGITPTDERKAQGAVFSPKTASFAQSLLVRSADADSGKIVDYTSFSGTDMVIGVVPGTTGEIYARQRAQEAGLPDSAIREYPGEDELLVALKTGDIDALARGEIGNRYQESLDPSFRTIALRDFGEGFAVSIDPSNGALQEALAQSLEAVTGNGAVGYQQWSADPDVFAGG